MATEPKSPEKSQGSFVDRKSIKNLATASAALTMLLNVIMLVYAQMKPSGMSNGVLAGLAVFLCVAYSLSFLKKDASSGVSEYVWLTALNSALLFSSLTGINSTLKKVGEPSNTPDTTQITSSGKAAPVKSAAVFGTKPIEASFGFGDLKNIIIPKQAWFNPATENTLAVRKLRKDATQLSSKALLTINQTDTVLNKVIAAQKTTHQKTDSLSTALHDLRDKYIQALAQISNYQANIVSLNEKLQACSKVAPTISSSTLQAEIEASKSKQAEQQNQQAQQVKVQQYRVIQQKQQQQLIILQQKRVNMVKSQLQQQQKQ